MGFAERFPEIPAKFEELTGETKAAIMVQNWARAGESFSNCELNRQTLIDWIKGKPSKEDQ
jgi:hypothetical protein